MLRFRFGLAVLFSLILAGCGGGGGNDQPPKPTFTSLVTFGDSLSDVGTYAVAPAVAAYGGGQFTINAAGTSTNWTEFLAPQLGLGAPCPAETGADDGGGANTVAVIMHPTCTNYAEGGSRVTDPVGINNKASPLGAGFALTVPITTQIDNHLAAHTSFTANDLVVVMAGANDVFYQAGLVSAAIITPASAVAAVSQAATDLAKDVNTKIIAKGATHVVVMNVPDIASTPYGVSTGATGQQLIGGLVQAFNAALQAALPDSANVLNVDANTANRDEIANPSLYGLSNVTIPACNTAALPGNSSLFCTAGTLNAGVDSYYLFADGVHPTPYAHALFSIYVLQAMTNKGWY